MGDEDMTIAPEDRLRDWAEDGAPSRLNKKFFGRMRRIVMRIFKYLKNLILRCSETRQLARLV
jgi:hypothetical protein